MKRFLIADTHLGHKNIISYCSRPFHSVQEMDERLILFWNQTVSMEDIVYVLGDFTLSRRLEIIEKLSARLNGRKILIMGNHDTRKPKDYVKCGFEVATRKPMMVEPGIVLMHEPFEDLSFLAPQYLFFFGHVHNKHTPMDDMPNCFCVSAERIDYRPVSMDDLIKKIRLQAERNIQKGGKKDGLTD